MPPKDIEITEISKGILYLNDKPIMEFDKFDICEPPITDEVPETMKFFQPQEITIEIETARIDKKDLLSLLLGRKVTNNWLKMHGGVMTRKKGRKK